MKGFIAYRHTGADSKELEVILGAVRDAFVSLGVEVYCTFFDEGSFRDKEMEADEIMDNAFTKIDQCDFMFVLQASSEKSEGMLIEVGYCRGTAVPMIIATRVSAMNTYLPKMSPNAFRWSTIEELVEGIKTSVRDAQYIMV